ncbi:MAG: hypothetical protein HYY06_19610 [Deltaproteobacteria bacterium]|nr:hypothetical protein [Deltaproteobacteria bacterium]
MDGPHEISGEAARPGPPFGALGAALLAASLADFALGRLLVGSLPAPPHGAITRTGGLEALRQALLTPATFAHGMVAVLALAMNFAALAAVLRDPGFASAARRLTLLVLAIFALPVIAISLVLRVPTQMIFMALTATVFIGVICAVNASLARGPAPAKVMSWLLVLPLLFGYVDTLTRLIPALGAWTPWSSLPRLVALGTEAAAVLCGLLAPIAFIAPGRSAGEGSARASRAPLVAALLAGLVPTMAVGALALLAWPETQSLAARTIGIELQVPFAQPLYLAALLGYLTTAAYHLWPRRHPAVVTEIGLGLCALMFGGCGTFTPFRISLLLLGLQLVALGIHRLSARNHTTLRTVTPAGT